MTERPKMVAVSPLLRRQSDVTKTMEQSMRKVESQNNMMTLPVTRSTAEVRKYTPSTS